MNPTKRLNILIGAASLWVFITPIAAQKDSSNNKKTLLFPVITRSIETSWSFGLAGAATFKLLKKDTATRTSNLQTIVLYSLKKQFIAAINGAQYLKNEDYIINEQLSYSSFPDKFWGLGNQSTDNIEEQYDFKQFYLYLHLMRHLGNHFYAGVFDQQNIIGRNGYQISGLGLSVTYDKRNNAFAPNKGAFAQIYFNHFGKIYGSDFTYTNMVVDLRKYMPLSKKDVLAIQGYSYSSIGNEVPLRSLASFGGMNSMRGYYSGRYRDKMQMVFQSELRHQLNNRFGLVAFGNFGDVGHKLQDFNLSDLKYSLGAGLRFAINKSEKLNLRLDYGVGPGLNHGFYFELGEAF